MMMEQAENTVLFQKNTHFVLINSIQYVIIGLTECDRIHIMKVESEFDRIHPLDVRGSSLKKQFEKEE